MDQDKTIIIFLSIIIVILLGLVFLPNLFYQERTAKVTVTKERKGVFIVEIYQGDDTQIFLR